MDIRELKKISKTGLLKFNGVEDAYNKLVEDLIETASVGTTNKFIYKVDYNDEVIWYLLLRVLLLDGYKLNYFKYDEQEVKAEFDTADFVDISWGE